MKQIKTSTIVAGLFAATLAFVLVIAGSVSSAQAATYTFSRSLTIGSVGADVKALQQMLNASADTQVSTSGAGAPGLESTYFGAKTKAAVARFQAKNSITPAVGYFGPLTRSVANAGGVVANPNPNNPAPTPGAGIAVSSPSQPSNGLAIQGITGTGVGAARVPFTKVTLTAGSSDVTVNGIVVERTGAAVDAVFAGIVLLDENGAQLDVEKTFSSTHQATVGGTFVVKAGTSKTLTVAGNMTTSATNYAGQVASLSVVQVNTAGTVSGSLPITGAMHTINASLVIGSITIARGTLDPNATVDKEAGTTGYTFSAARLTAGSVEKVRIHSVRWNQSGSAGASDITNVQTVVDGTSYGTTVSADGKYYTATFGTGIVVDKGLSKEISIKGDIVGGSGRTIAFDLYRTTDLVVTGETYGYGITPPTSGTGFASTNPWYDASVVTITGGTVNSVSKSNGIPAQNIAILAANQPLGGFEVEIRGEAITVGNIVVNLTATGDEVADITNVSLVDQNGSVVAGPVDGVNTTGSQGTVTFSSTVRFPVGKTTLSLKGQLNGDFVQGDTIQASTTPSSQWTVVRGENTNNTISLSSLSSAITANLMTVKAGSLAFSVSAQPTARAIIAGAKGFEFARYNLDASQSGEDVKVTSIKALLALTTITASQLSSCNLWDGSTNVTDGTNVTLAAGDNTYTFNNGGIIVSKGTQKSLSMKCDLSAGATSGTVKWGLTDNSSTYTGATAIGSGQTVTETMTATAGQTMTAATAGSFTVTEDTAILYKMAQAGTNGIVLASLRVTAGASEAIDLKQLALQLGNTASSSPADLVGEKVTLWYNGSQIGTAQFGGANPDNATSTLFSPAPRIAAGESVLIVVKGDLSAQNVNEGTPGAFLAVTYDADNSGINGNYATGVDSQTTATAGTSSDVTTAGLRIFRTVPSIAVTSCPNGTCNALSAGGDLYKFVVTNPNSRDVVFEKFSFSIATTSGNVSAFTLYGDGVAFNSSAINTDSVGTLLEMTATTTSQAKIVPANGSKTYILKAATSVDTASVSETINIALLADTSYPAIANAMGTVTTVEAGSGNTDNIIWSPFSTTTPVATEATESNLDWTNGYGLPGFPANAAFPVQTWTRAN